jgi:hypothetical protein
MTDNVKNIGNAAFYNCSSLSNRLILPRNLVAVGNEAFQGVGTIKAYAGSSAIEAAAAAGYSVTIIDDVPVEKVSAVTANPASGAVTSGTTVALSSATNGTTIRYTTNGSEPTAASTSYSSPITITAATTIKAKAFKSGMTNSDTSTFTYTVIVENAPTITVGKVSGHPGEEVDITVSLANNPGLAGFVLDLNFDNTKLTPVSITRGAVISGDMFNSNLNDAGVDLSMLTSVTAAWFNASNVTENGVVFTVRFKIKETVTDETIPITISVESAANQTPTSVALTTVSGSVDVMTFIYGDIFEDGAVNVLDAVRLAQYLAKWQTVTLSPAELSAADVYPDGIVDVRDAVRLAQYLAGWSDVVLGQL